MSFTTRYKTITKGAVTFTGNTLGLSQLLNQNVEGDSGSIGAFITLQNTTVPTFPQGTTLNYKENSSEAILNIPNGSTVLYAELVWGGNYLTRDEDMSANLDDSVTFTTPNGVNVINPSTDTATQSTFINPLGVRLGFYVRSQDVTSLVASAGAGTYSAGGILGLVDPLNASTGDTNHAGWTLAVVYSNPSLPLRSIALYIGGEPVSAGTSTDILIDGFVTPSTGDTTARLLISAGEGDAIIVGDGVGLGPVGGPLTALSGSNNLVNNFFGSQINDDNGDLDQTGTFGTRNMNPATTTNIVGGRQGWDITNIDVSNVIGNGETEATLEFRTQGDLYMTNATALQIDLPQVAPTINKEVDKSMVILGDNIEYTITITNSSEVNMDNVVFIDSLPPEVSYNGDFAVDGSPLFGDVNTGINIGTINTKSSVTLTFSVKANSVPLNNVVENISNIEYEYTVVDTKFEDTAISNVVDTIIANPSSSILKEEDKSVVTNGDTINYTLTVTNTGNVTNNNVTVTDTIPSGTTLVPNSLQVITLPLVGDLNSGVILGDMLPGTEYKVLFSVTVDDNVAIGEIIQNYGTVSFDINGSVPYVTNSNTVDALLQKASFENNFIKSVDKPIVDIGETIKYTFTIKNIGNVAAENVMFVDTMQLGNEFVLGSVTVDTLSNPGNPEIGFSLGTINPNQTVIVTFDALVTSLPASNSILNFASIDYDYTNEGVVNSNSENSNTTDVVLNTGIILPEDAIKSADKSITTIGDTITYTVSMKNTGNVPLINVIVKDVMPDGTSFETGTVIVNSVPNPSYSPLVGIPVGTIFPNETATISFIVKVLDNGNNTINNTATILYNYNVAGKLVSKNVVTNNVVVEKVAPIISIVKSQNKSTVAVNDIVTYTFTISNTGTVDVTSLVVSDLLDPSLQFEGNVKLNNVPISGNILAGIDIGALNIGQIDTLEFDVKVISVPPTSIISNKGSYLSSYTVEGNTRVFTLSGDSNVVNLDVITPKLTMTKVSDKEFVEALDTFKYTINIKNEGNVVITNAILTDIIPPELSVTNINVNGVDVPGNLTLGVNIGTINISASINVILTVLVLEEFEMNPYKNIATVNGNVLNEPNILVNATATDTIGVLFIRPHLSITKSSNVNEATVGETLLYTLIVNNDGDTDDNNVIVRDLLTPELEFVKGSVTVDGFSKPEESIITGINLGTVNKNEIVTITFLAKIISKNGDYIINKSDATYSYSLGIGIPEVEGNAISNENKVLVEVADIVVSKIADKQEVSLGEIVTYTVKIVNDGTTIADNVVFIDTLPSGLELVNDQVIVNGVIINGVDLEAGVDIGTILPNETVKIMYSAKVVGGSCDGYLKNGAYVNYKYILQDGTVKEKQSNVSEVSIVAQIQSFKQIIIDKYLEVPSAKPDIEDINDVFTEVIVDNYYVIKTPKITSNEGQVLSGYKLVIHGCIKIATKYTALLPTQPVHSAHYTIPFGSFIILPSDYVMGSNVEVTGIVEGIRFEKLDNRHVFANTAILLIAKNII